MKFLEDLVSPEDAKLARLFVGVNDVGEVLRVDWDRLLGAIPIDGNGRTPTEEEFNKVMASFCLGGVMSVKTKDCFSVVTEKDENTNPLIAGTGYSNPEKTYFVREEDALRYIVALRTKFQNKYDSLRVIKHTE